MSTRLLFSNRIERLAERLAENLKLEQQGRDPFVHATIMVPNQSLKKWLQLHLADRHQVMINVDFPFLEKGLWQILQDLHGDRKPTIKPLDRERLQLMILTCLWGDFSRFSAEERANLAPLESYLWDGDKPRPNQARRAWQLAERLAGFFTEYAYHRQDMVSAWLAGHLSRQRRDPDERTIAMESCQMTLYRLIMGQDGLRAALDSDETFYRTLPELKHLVLDRQPSPPATRPRVPIHIFGLSQISPFHCEILFELSSRFDLHLYQMNVCAEYWEDVETPAERRWWDKVRAGEVVGLDDGEELEIDDFENPLLQWWGRAGRETLKLLANLEERSIDQRHFETEWLAVPPSLQTPTVLHVLQAQIFGRTSSLPAEPLHQDTSLQVVGCPGLFREVETVYQSILHNMQQDPTLRFSDIAVLVPDIVEYQPVFHSVFGREDRPAYRVRYNISDMSAAEDSIFGQGVMRLLELASGAVTRHDFFALALNPCFLAAHRLSRDDVIVWLKWADDLNIFRCLDQEDKIARGYEENALYTWAQGLRRLRLGRLMQVEAATNPRQPPVHLRGLIPHEDMNSHDDQQLGAFCLILESLFARLRTIRRQARDGTRWRDLIESLILDFLEVPDDAPHELHVKNGVLMGLQRLDDIHDLQAACEADATPLSLGFVVETVRACLGAIASRHGNYLSGGVNISSLRPMRPVPFRIVYVMGLGERKFPGDVDPSTLDLRKRYRQLGDVSRPDENRYLFLETLASTRDKLYLTYVNKDLCRDQVFHPCTIINQLLNYLRSALNLHDFQIQHAPLHGSSLTYFSPPAGESGDALINYDSYDRLQATLRACQQFGLDRPGPMNARIKQAERQMALPAGNRPPEHREVIRLHELQQFLLNPMEAAIQRHLRLGNTRFNDAMLAEGAPFTLSPIEKSDLAKRVLGDAIAIATKHPSESLVQVADELLDSHFEHKRLLGAAPDGAFAELSRNKLRENLHERLQGGASIEPSASIETRLLQNLRNADIAPPFIMGQPGPGDAPGALVVEPLMLSVEVDGESRQVELHGSLPISWKHACEAERDVLVITNSKPAKHLPPSQIMRAWLFMVAAQIHESPSDPAFSLSRRLGCGSFTLQLVHREGISSHTYKISPEQARTFLTRVIQKMLSPACFQQIPYELIDTKWRKELANRKTLSETEKEAFHQDLSEGVRDHAAGSTDFSGWYPREELFLLAPTVPKDAYDRMLDYLGLLLGGTHA